jgi:tetratricopeptide (TPR) repeat protein
MPTSTCTGVLSSSTAAASRLVAAGTPERRGISIVAIFVSLLIVALGLVSAASTYVALEAIKERDRARTDLAEAAKTIDQYVQTISTSNELKGTRLAKARAELYKPAVDYYQQYTQKHHDDKKALAEMADAYYHLAGIQAKTGAKEALTTLNDGMRYINLMKAENADAAKYPSLNQSAMKYTMPTEWFPQRGGGGGIAAIAPLIITFDAGNETFSALMAQYPQSPIFRDDLAAMMRIPATLYGFAGVNGRAITSWQRAVDALTPLVAEQPSNMEYKARLAEALSGIASRQMSAKKPQEAVPHYERALKLHEAIAAAQPDDATSKQQLTVAKRALERAQKELAKKEGTPKAETAAKPPTAEAGTAPAKEAEGDAPPATSEPSSEAPATP